MESLSWMDYCLDKEAEGFTHFFLLSGVGNNHTSQKCAVDSEWDSHQT